MAEAYKTLASFAEHKGTSGNGIMPSHRHSAFRTGWKRRAGATAARAAMAAGSSGSGRRRPSPRPAPPATRPCCEILPSCHCSRRLSNPRLRLLRRRRRRLQSLQHRLRRQRRQRLTSAPQVGHCRVQHRTGTSMFYVATVSVEAIIFGTVVNPRVDKRMWWCSTVERH